MIEEKGYSWDSYWKLGLDEKDTQKRLGHFEQAFELAKKNNDSIGKAASQAAIRLIQVISEKDRIVFSGAGILNVLTEPSVIRWFGNPAFCTSLHDFRDNVGHPDWHLVWQPLFPYAYWSPGFRIPMPTVLNKSSVGRSDHLKMESASTIVSLTESVEVPAGVFENCLKLRTVVTRDEGEEQHGTGTVWSWFAPKVGLVNEQYNHHDGDETVTQLVDFSVKETVDSPFPLGVGNQWEYRGIKQSNPVVATHVYWIEEEGHQDAPGIYCWRIPYYSYATLEEIISS